MKKALAFLIAASMILGGTACGSSTTQTKAEIKDETVAETAEEMEVVVFAAASMTETLTQISELYKEVAPNVTLIFNFDSSGTLKTQIEEGAVCDLFISAGQKQMNQIDIHADKEINIDSLDFVEEGTRINLLENKVVLAVPDDNPKGIETFEDMVSGLKDGSILLAMGNADVPVGQYTQKILSFYELSEEDLAKSGSITYGSNVKEVTTQIKEGTVDCGIIYCTDAYSAELNIVDDAAAEMCGQVIYPAAVMNTSEIKEAALEFLNFLTSDEAMIVFETVGFAPAE